MSIHTALKGKKLKGLAQRASKIAARYGWTVDKMDAALERFALSLKRFECGATFPITALVLERHPQVVVKYQAENIEFAIHGYRHIDHHQLSQAAQLKHLGQAVGIFQRNGLQPHGFRSPYLRGNQDTWQLLQQYGFVYDSSQGLAWDVLDGDVTSAYQHVLDFYGAQQAADYPSLPRVEEGLLRIPYSLPDDEALVERLRLAAPERKAEIWCAVLDQSWRLGELFTLGLHPERIAECEDALCAVLARARRLTPAVWIARLDEIASWWQSRALAVTQTCDIPGGGWQVTVDGPDGTTVLARNVRLDVLAAPWADGYQRVRERDLAVYAPVRPFVGIHPRSPASLGDFLRHQGYIVEVSELGEGYAFYLDPLQFEPRDERALLTAIEGSDKPLVRLGRWPNGAHSALAISGDIDALTLSDYGLRSLGR